MISGQVVGSILRPVLVPPQVGRQAGRHAVASADLREAVLRTVDQHRVVNVVSAPSITSANVLSTHHQGSRLAGTVSNLPVAVDVVGIQQDNALLEEQRQHHVLATASTVNTDEFVQ
ncbi:uncharacterized protein LOC106640532 [Copidosoma floridanum]|uniref:uncharacterized protein LOC106640532 n=1 Tax=Copidosoma floridanum TaxID=29053 RepID=UPI0006C9D5E2|nr:uncharacterized protein LOC106640532 [Copidosoma floridanum]